MKHLLRGLFIAVLFICCNFQLVLAQPMQELPVDKNVRIGKLDNGLTYYIRHNALPEKRVEFYIAQKVGSILEEPQQRGLAHFLEHIPGRADYIHYIADLIQPDRVANDLQTEEEDANEQKTKCRCLDVGVGANCIYPIIGHTEYGWTFVGSDIDPVSIENARKIVTCNPVLAHKIDLRLQKDSQKIFDGIIMPGEYFDVTICNPPFHSSKEEAEDGTLRKLSSLKGTKVKKVQLNFGGSANELWCEGGEIRFILNMISESQKYQKNCGWFTSLVSKEKNLEKLCAKLKSVNASEYKIIRMQQGTKSSRILAWRFSNNS